jgi:hypothetical protein
MYAQVLADELRQPESRLFVIHLARRFLSVGEKPTVAVCPSVRRCHISLLWGKRGDAVWLCNMRLSSWLDNDDVGAWNDRWLGAFDAFAGDFLDDLEMRDATRSDHTAHHVFDTAELPTGTSGYT